MPDQGQPTFVAAPAAAADPASLLPAGSLLAAPERTTRVIARWVQRILAEKGGVGTLRATTAINLAAAFVEADHECLLVDMDAQGGGATARLSSPKSGALGVRTPPAERSVLAVLLEHALLANVIVHTDAGLDLVPSPLKGIFDNFGLAGLAFMADLAKEMRLRAALSRFVNTPDCVYSYIFIDCPPRLDVFSVNALVAADVVLIPIVPEPLLELTLGDVFRAIRHVRLLRAGQSTLEIKGFVPNRVNRRREALTRDVLGRLPPGVPVLPAIHDSAYINPLMGIFDHAPQSGKTIFQLAPNSAAAEEYRQLAREIANGRH